MNLNFLNNLPPQKKKVLSIGGIAFIVLLFISFLLSLGESDQPKTEAQEQIQQNVTEPLTTNNQQIPNSKLYDFDNNQEQADGLEALLNENTKTEIGVDNNPFENMTGTLEIGQTGQGEAPSYGPAPIPQEEEAAPEENYAPVEQEEQAPAKTSAVLYCDSFKSSNEAESQKAMLAFQGISATVVEKDGEYRLKIGPFNSTEEARAKFQDLGAKGLVQTCSLIKQ